MNIAIIGYGKMGKLIEKIAKDRGHQIVSIIDINNSEEFESESFKKADVALEFTTPSTAYDNIIKAWKSGVKVVSGTTGWDKNLQNIQKACSNNGNTLFWASNFSLGVNIFFELNKKIAKVLNDFPQYKVSIEETHHSQKKDAPSGTAVTLANCITDNLSNKNGWTLVPELKDDKIPITAIRQGDVFGIHTTKYESNEDVIKFTHEAKSRDGFALGAVIAAEFINDKTGFFTMSDLLKL